MLLLVAVIVSLEKGCDNVALKVPDPPARPPSAGKTAEGSLLVKWTVPE